MNTHETSTSTVSPRPWSIEGSDTTVRVVDVNHKTVCTMKRSKRDIKDATLIINTIAKHDRDQEQMARMREALEFMGECLVTGLEKGYTVHDLLHATWDGKDKSVMGTIRAALE